MWARPYLNQYWIIHCKGWLQAMHLVQCKKRYILLSFQFYWIRISPSLELNSPLWFSNLVVSRHYWAAQLGHIYVIVTKQFDKRGKMTQVTKVWYGFMALLSCGFWISYINTERNAPRKGWYRFVENDSFLAKSAMLDLFRHFQVEFLEKINSPFNFTWPRLMSAVTRTISAR